MLTQFSFNLSDCKKTTDSREGKSHTGASLRENDERFTDQVIRPNGI
jgi:hypothetical protein